MNTLVNFDIAKLLKEKGCDIQSTFVYKTENNKTFVLILSGLNPMDGLFSTYSAPKIAKVVMWLYEKHGVWISVWRYRDYAAACNDCYSFKHNYSGSTTFKTPTEAYSAAILYTLNNLIIK